MQGIHHTSLILLLLVGLNGPPLGRFGAMAFAPPSLVESTPLRVRTRPGGRHSEPTVTTEPLFLMEVAMGNTNQRQQQQEQQQVSSSSSSTVSGQSLTTRHLSQVSAPLAATSAALHASLLCLLGNTPGIDTLGFSRWMPTATMATTASSSSSDFAASKVFQELSHLALDIITLTGAPSMMGARLASVAGRMFSLTADYLPDHFVAPEEWFFQLLMLHLAFCGLFQTASHAVVSQFLFYQQQQQGELHDTSASTVEDQDRHQQAFRTWFQPARMTWNQYKAFSVFAGDWITLEPGQSLTTTKTTKQKGGDYAYFLFQGTVLVGNVEDKARNLLLEAPSSSGSTSIPVLGAMNVLQQLDEARNNASLLDPYRLLENLCLSSANTKREEQECALMDLDDLEEPQETWTAVHGSVTVLRIHAPAALNLIRDYDETLEAPLRNLLWQGLQAKLSMSWNNQ